MNSPILAAQRFLPAILLGCALGILWGFLRPLRRKAGLLADLIFLIPMFWAWIYLSFGICLGDLRLIYTLTLLASALVWDRSLGLWLAQVFDKFWGGIFGILGWFSSAGKNFFLKCKNFEKSSLQPEKKGL